MLGIASHAHRRATRAIGTRARKRKRKEEDERSADLRRQGASRVRARPARYADQGRRRASAPRRGCARGGGGGGGGVASPGRTPTRWLARTRKSNAPGNRQWGLRAINWYRANRPNAGNVTVAVLDTGIDAKHPDLSGLTIDYQHE